MDTYTKLINLQSQINSLKTKIKCLCGLVSNSGAGAGYLVYTALLSQESTDAPVATVLENTLGGTVVWTYSSVGDYRGTLAGAFTGDKTVCFVSLDGGVSDGYFALASRFNDDSIIVLVYDNSASGVNNNGFSVEIRVYP